MGFQSGLLAAAGSIAGAVGSIKKTLKQRQEEQMKKVQEQQEAKKVQQQRFRKSLILDKSGQNIMIPVQPKKQEPNKSILLDTNGRNLTNGK